MIIATTIDEVRAAGNRAAKIGFIPTMGFLHEGHLSLIDAARDAGANFIAVSIFVNPTQFGPNEDLASYPRDEARDKALLESKNVDLLFLPCVGRRAEARPRGASRGAAGRRGSRARPTRQRRRRNSCAADGRGGAGHRRRLSERRPSADVPAPERFTARGSCRRRGADWTHA